MGSSARIVNIICVTQLDALIDMEIHLVWTVVGLVIVVLGLEVGKVQSYLEACFVNEYLKNLIIKLQGAVKCLNNSRP